MKISADLPTFMILKHSRISESPKKTLGIRRTSLNNGVSSESPVNFRVNYVPVLDQSSKNLQIGQKNDKFSRFLSDLKQNKSTDKRIFHYSDINNQNYDYDSIGFSKGMDICKGRSTNNKSLLSFQSEYLRFLDEGFGKCRGIFTVESSQAKVIKLDAKRIKFMRERVSLSQKKILHKDKVKDVNNKKVSIVNFREKIKNKKNLAKTPENYSYIKELEDFDNNLYKFLP